ncbi:hypothetical protein E2562_009248 [Oryza meyeriana var. granulata]|uniref:Uncharacterized protein n=1 Tax=Oryza meyeriana var. granulata TaxID=110450 RepID=A0A6G1D3D7_9ORYZ|nr:hypothetical protein E2562_009248 [Oryza meyeriana var. granulata]
MCRVAARVPNRVTWLSYEACWCEEGGETGGVVEENHGRGEGTKQHYRLARQSDVMARRSVMMVRQGIEAGLRHGAVLLVRWACSRAPLARLGHTLV